MRVLVYPHDLGIGGSQLNAIELAAAVRDLGHEVLVFGPRGPLERRISELDLEFLAAPEPSRRPSAGIVSALRRVVAARNIDVVHGYEWPPILESRLAVLGQGAACVGTVMSMSVAPFIPHHIPLVVGTAQIAAVEAAAGRPAPAVIEPPVDTVHNRPGLDFSGSSVRTQYGVPENAVLVVCVTRLARELKLEGLLTAIDVVPQLDHGVHLLLVGGGPATDTISRAVQTANERARRTAVHLCGEVEDPRPAYDAADVVLGMGGSALRAMAFGKPLVVQGENGFWRALSSETLEAFLWSGWYGIGARIDEGAPALRRELGPLLRSPELRRQRGDFALRTVVERFSLSQAAGAQVRVYEHAATTAVGSAQQMRQDTVATRRFLVHVLRRKVQRVRGRAPSDDFNARPALLHPPLPVGAKPTPPMRSTESAHEPAHPIP